jgi:hypothetical protein
MFIDPADIFIKLDDDWSIIQWVGYGGDVYHDIWHCVESIATGRYAVIQHCSCGKEVPDAVQGFLVICRSTR